MPRTWITLPITFDSGTFIEAAVDEAVRLARVLDVYVTFDFHGVECHVGPAAAPTVVCEEYRCQVQKTEGIKFLMIG